MTATPLLWQPSPERVAAANMTAFAARAAVATGRPLPDYASLWRWSVDDKEAFWRELWDYAGVVGERGARTLADGDRMPGARWFPDARLNFAENLLAGRAAEPERGALVFRGEDKVERAMTNRELLALVSRAREGARRGRVWARATASPRTCPTCPKRSRRCSPPSAAARSGRRARRTSASRACSTASGRSSPRCSSPSTATGTTARPCRSRTRWRRSPRRCRRSSASSSCPYLRQTPEPDRRPRGDPRRRRARRVHRAASGGPGRVSAPSVRPSAVHPLLVGNDRRAEVHRPRRRRHAAAAPEGAPAARRREARRPALLLHDLRLDDVELAGVGSGHRARRCCSTTARRSPCRARCCGTTPTASG